MPLNIVPTLVECFHLVSPGCGSKIEADDLTGKLNGHARLETMGLLNSSSTIFKLTVILQVTGVLITILGIVAGVYLTRVRAQEAKDAAARLEQRLSQRRITEEQIARMAGVLSTGPKCSVQVFYVGGDPEAEAFARDVHRLLEQSGFPQSVFSWHYRVTTDSGIKIRLPKAGGRTDVVASLQNAFKAEGIDLPMIVDAQIFSFDPSSEFQIYVAHKPQPAP